jgi:hypothetical protein
MNRLHLVLLAGGFLAMASAAGAQGLGLGTFETSSRFFSGPESGAYVSAKGRLTLIKNLGFRYSAMSGAVRTTTISGGTLRSGGSEIEGGVEGVYSFVPGAEAVTGKVGYYLGATVANMANFDGTALAFDVHYVTPGVPFKVGLKGLSGSDMGIAMAYTEASVTYGTVSYSAFLGSPVRGNNTRSENTGAERRGVVWAVQSGTAVSLGLYSVNVSAFVGNQLGLTTGGSITPALGGKVGFGFSAAVKF